MMKINPENVGDFINKNPNEKIKINHGSGKYTFHNVGMFECVIFALKSTFKNFNKRMKDREQLHRPVMQRIMEQFGNPQTNGIVDPKAVPPRGMKLSWDAETGYYYTKAGSSQTNNQGIKESNLMPKNEETK